MANPVKIEARVLDVIHHSETVATYRLAPQGRVPKFQPGQFLHLSLDAYYPESPWPESRAFSIASAPSRRRVELVVTVSVKGSYTKRIVDTLEVGSECWLKLPYGALLFRPDGHLTMIAGGVGITPFVSQLKHLLEQASAQPVTLYYGVRNADHYLYEELLVQCQAVLPHFKYVLFCEDESLAACSGYLSISAIHNESPEDTTYYLSGPPDMIMDFKQHLLAFAVTSDRIRIDDWE